MSDSVDHPPHYGGEDNPYETIKVIESVGHHAEVVGFLKWNAYKYLSRLGRKGDVVEDAGKAAWYANRLVEFLKKIQPKAEPETIPVVKEEIPEEFADGAVLDVVGHHFTDRHGFPMCEVCFVGYYTYRKVMGACGRPPYHKWVGPTHDRSYCEECGTFLKQYGTKSGLPSCVPVVRKGDPNASPDQKSG